VNIFNFSSYNFKINITKNGVKYIQGFFGGAFLFAVSCQ
jgi:hypothetical protein